LTSPEKVEADVVGDPVQPRPEAGTALEAVCGPPGTQHRLLNRVFGLEPRTEHSVAERRQFPPMGFEVRLCEDTGLPDLSDGRSGHSLRCYGGIEQAGRHTV
jgi:hypothetical protein